MEPRACAHCGADISCTHANQRYCNAACRDAKKWAERPRIACSQCGGPTGWTNDRSSQRVDRDSVTCNRCRRAKPTYRVRNQRASGVVQRWDCAGCGVACERPATKGQRPKWCEQCRVMALRNKWIQVAPSVRLGIYEQADWVCWLCEESVDRLLIGSKSIWRPSLDHVQTRSSGGSDDPSNLRLAHFWCNSARSDERAYLPEDFRVA